MTKHTFTESRNDDGILFIREDGERFLLTHLDDDGSAQLVRVTAGTEHWGVHLDRTIALKIEAARKWVSEWPDNPHR